MRTLNLGLALLHLAGCGPSVEELPEAPVGSGLFPPASAPLILEGGVARSLSLGELLDSYRRTTGLNVVIAEDIELQLRAQRVHLSRGLEVSPTEVQTFVEGLLSASSFVLVPIDPVDLLAGIRVTTASRASAGYLVAAGDVARFAGHHALMVETVLEVHPPGRPGSRLDHLVGLVDPGTKAEPHAEGLLLRGTGSSVARMVALLRTASGD